jgi:hypothetical protein
MTGGVGPGRPDALAPARDSGMALDPAVTFAGERGRPADGVVDPWGPPARVWAERQGRMEDSEG